jgi:hypothetical protein
MIIQVHLKHIINFKIDSLIPSDRRLEWLPYEIFTVVVQEDKLIFE